MSIKLSGIRRGLTLVELLVVMVIMLVLATIVVAFAPGFQDAQKVARGADQLQGLLLTARQWAKKDRVPTGLRLSISNNVVTDLQYIQQPSTYMVPYATPALPPGQQPIARSISITGSTATVDTTSAVASGQTAGDFLAGGTNPVQAGDYLVLHEAIYSITGVGATQLTLGSALPANITSVPPTTDYYFVRGPRPLTGESTLKLPQDVVIDMAQSIVPGSNGVQYDILFSPSGELLAPASSNKVILWVRDITKPAGATDDTLIAIDMRTGLIAAQPVNVGGPDLYLFTKDGRSSGL